MTFKDDWEKTDQHFELERSTIEDMLKLALPNKKLAFFEVISGGCANFNIKCTLSDTLDPLILRIYLRDKNAAYQEQKLATLIKDTVPLPEVYFVGDIGDYRFAITEFKRGITLRELLLRGNIENIQPVMSEVGSVLAKIQNYRFPQSGFFDKDLQVKDCITQDFWVTHAKKCLKHPTTVSIISEDIISKIYGHLDRYHFLFPDNTQNHLVHADFDPANILVENVDNTWKISAVLDWEFAFSGSTLCDIANMLRYAHHMPVEYEQSFLTGLQSDGYLLPENWRTSVSLLNLVSLLDCLTHCTPTKFPHQCSDIRSLVTFIVQQLDDYR